MKDEVRSKLTFRAPRREKKLKFRRSSTPGDYCAHNGAHLSFGGLVGESLVVSQ